jgi:acetyltransferase
MSTAQAKCSRTRLQTAASALSRILEPHSVAIIGASASPDKRGYQILRALKQAGYPYRIYPVNPRGGMILCLPVFENIESLPEGIDLAVIVRPAHEVPEIIQQCGSKGIPGAVVLAHGFRERGESGIAAETAMLEAARTAGVRIIGPNTSGMLNSTIRADFIGLPELPPAGPVSVLTQSGNMILTAVEDSRSFNGPGFDVVAGLGNQSDVSYGDLISELGHRASTRSIAIYTEGIVDGRDFLDRAAQVARRCPIVMLRGGRSAEGQRAALSHTGSMTGSDEVALSVLPQAGVTLVDRADELLPVATVLATCPSPRPGCGVAVVADGGGHATIAVDALSRSGVPLASLSVETRTKLQKLLGLEAIAYNPIDVASAADAYPDVFPSCVEILSADPSVGLILVTGLVGAYHVRFDQGILESENQSAEKLVALQRSTSMPVVIHSCYAHRKLENHDILRNGGIPVFSSLDIAVAGIAALFERAAWLSKTCRQAKEGPTDRQQVALPSGLVPETTAREILRHLEIPTGEWRVAEHPDAVKEVVAGFSRPCAVKIDSNKVAHKSDVGCVCLDVTPDTARNAALTIAAALETAGIHDWTPRYIVSPMVKGGVELFVGAKVDPTFGPIVLFGAGGTLVEVIRDVAIRAAPVSPEEAMTMIAETRVSALLDGFRNLGRVDRSSLSEFISKVSHAILKIENVSELDMNPVIANRDGLFPVDVRLIGR